MLAFPIETILFDLDGTLRHSHPSADDTQFGFANQLGAQVAPALQPLGTRWSHYYWAQSPELLDDLRRFGETNDDFWIHYSYRYLRALTVPAARAAELAPEMFCLMENEYDPENRVSSCVPETLQSLKEAGFTLGLVSNRSRPCQEECESLGLLGYFDFAYVAAEVEAWKPDPRIFDRALQLSGSAPKKMIYIGDNFYADIIGAQNAGLQPILIDPQGVFPEAKCPVIRSLEELTALLGINGKP